MSAVENFEISPTPQPAFGLHKIHNTWFLFQDTLPDGAPIALVQDQTNVHSCRNTDVSGIGGACTHNINPYLIHRKVPKCNWEIFTKLANDPLVELFLPVPMAAKRFSSNVLLLDVSFNPSWFFLIKNLERLSSPLHSKVDPWLSQYQNKRMSDLELSNLQPLVYSLTGAPLTRQTELEVLEVVQAANKSTLQRPVLLLANSHDIQTLKTRLGDQVEQIYSGLTEKSLVTNIMHLPFEHMGSRVMGHFCITENLKVT